MTTLAFKGQGHLVVLFSLLFSLPTIVLISPRSRELCFSVTDSLFSLGFLWIFYWKRSEKKK